MKKILFIIASLLVISCSSKKTISEPRTFTDVTLVGYWHREPYSWDASRFAPHVSWKTPDGSEHWLFEAFLFLEGSDWIHGKNLTISPSGVSADKEVWKYQLDLWLGDGGGE